MTKVSLKKIFERKDDKRRSNEDDESRMKEQDNMIKLEYKQKPKARTKRGVRMKMMNLV